MPTDSWQSYDSKSLLSFFSFYSKSILFLYPLSLPVAVKTPAIFEGPLGNMRATLMCNRQPHLSCYLHFSYDLLSTCSPK